MTEQESAPNPPPEGWPFEDPPNLACFTVKAVIEERSPIHFVTHDADDGGWQFHGAEASTIEDALVVSLESMWKHDASIAELADLPLGWNAWRDAPGEPWTRSETVVEPDDELERGERGEAHGGSPLDVGYQLPDAMFELSDEERESRCEISSDFCSMDDTHFYVHGLVEIPLHDHDDHVAIGVWAEVSKDDYLAFVERYEHPDRADDPAMSATLATTLEGMDETRGVAAEIKIVDPNERPRVRVLDAGHVLGARQAGGLALQAWLEMLRGLNVM